VYLAELAPASVRRPLGFVVELLAAIPSVVYGLWGVFVLIPWLRQDVQPPLGESLGFLPFFSGAPRGFDEGDPVRTACLAPSEGAVAAYLDADLSSAELMAVTVESTDCPDAPTTDPVFTAELA